MIPRLLAVPLLLAAIQAGAAPVDPAADFRRLLVQGDVKAALAAVAAPPTQMAAKDVAMAECVRGRFGAPAATVDGPGAPYLAAYRTYWRSLMLGEMDKPKAEARLLTALNALLPGAGWDRKDLDATTEQVKTQLERQGLHALTGVTHPYYELMVWTSETPREYDVQLPEQAVRVKVVFLDGFQSRGWLSYASCETIGAGGWTADGVLYALADRYDTSSENFRVSYLGHEGQHFADNRAFPKLEQPELEYRAKLTELALAADPRPLLVQFQRGAQRGRGVPHAHAEFWVAERLKEAGIGADAAPDSIKAAARKLLLASSEQARKAGAGTVNRFLPD